MMFLSRWSLSQNKRTLLVIFVIYLLRIYELDAFLLLYVPRQLRPTAAAVAASSSSSISILIDPASSILDTNTVMRIEELLNKRSQARWNGDYELADEFRNQLDQEIQRQLQLSGFHIQIQDHTRQQGGGSQWTLHYDVDIHPSNTTKTVLQLAHQLLGMVASYSTHERHHQTSSSSLRPFDQLDEFVQLAKEQLLTWNLIHEKLSTNNPHNKFCFQEMDEYQRNQYAIVEASLTGRKAADAAFWFAMAGVDDAQLFDLLTKVCCKELARFGTRPSCRTKDIFAIIERLVAAGVQIHNSHELKITVQNILDNRQDPSLQKHRKQATDWNLHSNTVAMLIWNFSTRQTKQRVFLETAAKHWEVENNKHNIDSTNNMTFSKLPSSTATITNFDWNALFRDPMRPLVIDIGCGMGLSILGLASTNHSPVDTTPEMNFHWSDCNFVGVDLSWIAIQYANSIASRWGLREDTVAFLVEPADRFLDIAKSYPGPKARIMVQFPTPFRLAPPPTHMIASSTNKLQKISTQGNAQLPASATDGFMVTPTLLRRANELLKRADDDLLIQSNCEDVAIWIRNIAIESSGFTCRNNHRCLTDPAGTPTKRTLDWISMGGERAVGHGWIAEAVLPKCGRTETEIACEINGTPVHRCLLHTC